jgi:hypothetical protein
VCMTKSDQHTIIVVVSRAPVPPGEPGIRTQLDGAKGHGCAREAVSMPTSSAEHVHKLSQVFFGGTFCDEWRSACSTRPIEKSTASHEACEGKELPPCSHTFRTSLFSFYGSIPWGLRKATVSGIIELTSCIMVIDRMVFDKEGKIGPIA